MKKEFIILLVFASLFASPFFAITGCTEITSPGTYYLDNDISYNDSDILPGEISCIVVSSDDVILDCGGYSIMYVGDTARRPVSSNMDDFELRNCVLGGNLWTIHLRGNNMEIHNNEISHSMYFYGNDSNVYENLFGDVVGFGLSTLLTSNYNINSNSFDNGFKLRNIINASASNNNVSGNIEINGGHDNYIINNDIAGSGGGTGLWLYTSNDNTIFNNTIHYFGTGISIEYSFYNWINSNDLCFNTHAVVCDHEQYHDGENFCGDIDITCNITCHPCLGCEDPDYDPGDSDLLIGTTVTVHTPFGPEYYPDECISGDDSIINEAVCGGEPYYLVESCPDGYHCSVDRCVSDTPPGRPCLDNDETTDNPFLIGSGCFDFDTSTWFYDYCNPSVPNELVEYICTDAGCIETYHDCVMGCIDDTPGDHCMHGATCTDTDAVGSSTIVLETYGEASDSLGGWSNDTCVIEEGPLINEAYCTSSGIASILHSLSCGPHRICSEGECISVCNDNDPPPLENLSYPGVCTDSSGAHEDYCTGSTDIFHECHGLGTQVYQWRCSGINCVRRLYDCGGCCFAGVCFEPGEFDFEIPECHKYGGYDIWHRGILHIEGSDWEREEEDECVDDYHLRELFCPPLGEEPWDVVFCEYGCEEGACVPGIDCIDHDSSFANPENIPSEVTYGGDTYLDVCLDEYNLLERICIAGVPGNETHHCTYGCLDDGTERGFCNHTTITTCDESDPLQDIHVFGECLDSHSFGNPDICTPSGQLKQSYCEGTNCAYETPVDCPAGEVCIAGVCQEFVCVDSPDYGIDYDVNSTCIGLTTTGTDECMGDILTEYYCDSSQECVSINYTCPSGVCNFGRCANCTDSDGGFDPLIYGECVSDTNALDDNCCMWGGEFSFA